MIGPEHSVTKRTDKKTSPGSGPETREATRARIIDAADRLFYQQGYERTSFADIADAVEISRGNFYYHFKSKDEILEAVIDLRLAGARRKIARWEERWSRPFERILAYVDILVANRAHIKQHGCPIGTLCAELARLDHSLRPEANALFTLYRAYLRKQFAALGHNKSQADALAMQLIARSQGVATLASVFHDEKFLKREVQQLHAWVRNLAPDTGASKERISRSGAGAFFV